MSATDIRDARSSLELLSDTLQCRNPRGHKLVVITGSKEARDGAKHAAGLVAPGDATTVLENSLNLGLVVRECRHEIKPTRQIDGAGLDGEDHRLLGRQRKRRRFRVVRQIVR